MSWRSNLEDQYILECLSCGHREIDATKAPGQKYPKLCPFCGKSNKDNQRLSRIIKRSSDPIIRERDLVEIVLPWTVERVGYPKKVSDYLEEANEKYHDQINYICNGHDHHDRLRNKIVKEIAYSLAKGDHFGGKTRSLHIKEYPEMLGHRSHVSHLRTVNTGIYYPPSGGYDSYYGEYDWEPGGLYDMKQHRLATINFHFHIVEIPTSCLRKIT